MGILGYLVCIGTVDSLSEFPIKNRLEDRRRNGHATNLHQAVGQGKFNDSSDPTYLTNTSEDLPKTRSYSHCRL